MGLGLLVAVTVSAATPAGNEMLRPAPTASHLVWFRNCFGGGPGMQLELVGDTYTAAEAERLRDYANQLYRGRWFQSAADTLRPLRNDPDLQILAARYERLGRAWKIAHEERDPARAFPALREALTLDLSLGGAFAARLYREMSEIAPFVP